MIVVLYQSKKGHHYEILFAFEKCPKWGDSAYCYKLIETDMILIFIFLGSGAWATLSESSACHLLSSQCSSETTQKSLSPSKGSNKI